MFGIPITIPTTTNLYTDSNYKIEYNYSYDDSWVNYICNDILNLYFSSNKSMVDVNNNIIGDTMPDYSKKIFTELYDYESKSYVKLSTSVEFVVSSDEYGFYYSNDVYNVHAYGETQEEAEKQLYAELMHQYNSYAHDDDNYLDSRARKLKYNLLSLFVDNA